MIKEKEFSAHSRHNGLFSTMLKAIREIGRNYERIEDLLTVKEKSDLKTISRMYRQQKNYFRCNDSREHIPIGIVSISKPHLKQIVMDKEVKSVEFNAREI